MQHAARDRKSIELVERSRRNEVETTVGQLRAEITELNSQLSVSVQRVSLLSVRVEYESVLLNICKTYRSATRRDAWRS